MKAIVRRFVFALLIALAASAASASVGYVNPPDFTPQRTLFWDFSQSGWTTPTTIAGPTWGTGEMAGDSVASSNVNWYGSSILTSHTGMIGYNNLSGQTPVHGSMTIHLSNYSTQNPVKYLWMEVSALQWGAVTSDGIFSTTGEYQCDRLSGTDAPQADGSMLINAKWSIRPNPSWESFTWTFDVPAGGGILVDKFYVSTACVPEPSALMALGTGLVGLIGVASRKRRA